MRRVRSIGWQTHEDADEDIFQPLPGVHRARSLPRGQPALLPPSPRASIHQSWKTLCQKADLTLTFQVRKAPERSKVSTKAETPSARKLISLSHFRQSQILELGCKSYFVHIIIRLKLWGPENGLMDKTILMVIFMKITPGTRWKRWRRQETDKGELLWYLSSLPSSSFR